MPDSWKSIEREVARLTEGIRTWNSDLDIDVIAGGWAVEVKNLRAPSIADCERILAHNAIKAAAHDPPLSNALVVKRKAGAGKKTPYLAIFILGVPDVDKKGND